MVMILWGVLAACGVQTVAQQPVPLKLNATVGASARVAVTANGRIFLQSPEEGLWSMAIGWTNGWPTNWIHAYPSSMEQQGDWTILTGKAELPQGAMELRDAYRAEGHIIHGIRRFVWKGSRELSHCTLSVRWLAPGAVNARPMLPGSVCYGNPSGARTGKESVAVHGGEPGEETLFEEHRFAAPWTSIEWTERNACQGVALHSLPSLVPGGNQRDQWWSLGIRSGKSDTEMAILSGPCAANRRHSVTKALQGRLMDYPDTWLTMRPGMVIEKSFYLEAMPDSVRGGSFRQPLRTSMNLHPLNYCDDLPAYDDIIHEKYRFALSRFRNRDQDPGFEMFPDYIEGTHYVMGWCGQADAAAYAMIGLAHRIGDGRMEGYGARALNLLAQSPFNERGFQLKYTAETQKWADQDPVSQGQGMEGFARAIMAARKMRNLNSKPWEEFLKKACTCHAKRILREDWRPVNTAEGFFISPLCKGYALFRDPDFKRAAIKAGEYYAQRHMSMEEPYWGGTLDANCEDKEGAWAGFQGFLALYELTKEKRYLDWASHAMDVVLTYTVLWDIDLPPGRLRDHGLKTRGWTIVSAQNQHLDVFGVVYTPELWRMGDYLKRDDLKRLAGVMYRSAGQMIDPYGSQGEQIQHTNFGQHGDMSDLYRLRGGYSESWTVFWITAHFLNAAAEFERMGVDLDHMEEAIAHKSWHRVKDVASRDSKP